jgi:nitric oxide reductase NorD protein
VSAAIARLGLADRRDTSLPVPLPALRAAAEASAWLAHELPGFASNMDSARALALAARPAPEAFQGREALRERARRAALRGEAPWDDAALLAALRDARERGPIAPGESLFGERLESGLLAEASPLDASPETRPSNPESEAEAPRVGSVERVLLEKDERGDIVLNPFERVETLDSYRGGSRNLDGADDLDAHLEALSEVDLGKVTRGGGPANALLRADVQLDADAPDVASRAPSVAGIPFDEWNFRTRAYRTGWCTVYPRTVENGDERWVADAQQRHRRRIDELSRRLERHRAGLRSVDRQLDGEDVDLAALVAERAAVAAGFGGNPRLYVRQEHRRRDFATTVLLDVSLSTDAWIRGRRVLDVARDAVFVLGEVAAQLGDRLRVLAFASETRNQCRVWELLRWDEPWQRGRARLGAVTPQGYTRIGPAIRYATRDLAAVAAERKLLLLVSDGKPTDYDRYEGRYGIADVRQSLREAEQRGIRTHALAVDAVARAWLPELFGAGAWHVLPRPELLPDVLTQVYGRLTNSAR